MLAFLSGFLCGICVWAWVGQRPSQTTIVLPQQPDASLPDHLLLTVEDEELIAEATELSHRAATPYWMN